MRTGQLPIRQSGAEFDQAAISERFLRLDTVTYRMRFGGGVGAAFVKDYAARILQIDAVMSVPRESQQIIELLWEQIVRPEYTVCATSGSRAKVMRGFGQTNPVGG